MDHVTMIDNLKRAKARIQDRKNWWGKGRGDAGTALNPAYCALQSLAAETIGRPVWDSDRLRRRAEYKLLQQVSKEKYGKGVVNVNDSHGHRPIMGIYNEAIRRAKESAKAPEVKVEVTISGGTDGSDA